jgi:cell division septal protein FtsQ
VRGRRVVRTPAAAFTSTRRAPKPYRPVTTRHSVKQAVKLFLFFAGIGLGYQQFEVKQITVEGNRAISRQQIVDQANTAMQKMWLSENLLTLREEKLAEAMKEHDSRLREVSLRRQWPNALLIKVVERQPSLNWQTGGQTYLLDNDGSVIGISNDAAKPTVVDTSNLPVKPKDKIAPARFIEFCLAMVEQVTALDLNVVSLRITDTTNEVQATTNKGYAIKFDTTRDVASQISDLALVLDTLSKQQKTPTEYIDLRIPGKAYYR